MANPQKLLAKTQKAIQHFQDGQLDQAKKLLDDVTRQKAKIDVAYFLLATIHFRLGQLEQARRYFSETIKLNPAHFEALNNLGVVHERLGDLEQAKKLYQKSLQINPNYASALFHLGNLHQLSGQKEEAERLYRKVINSTPNHIKTINNLALILIDKNQCEEALVLLKQANQLDPNDAEVITNIGYALREQGKLAEALQYFEKAVAMDSHSSAALNHMGVLFQQLDDGDKAEQAYLEALKHSPNNPEVLTNLGNHYESLGEHERAQQAYQNALDIDPSYGPAWTNLGASMREQGDLTKAIGIYEQGQKLSPYSGEIRYNLGVSQLATAQFEKGWENYLFRPSFANSEHNTYTGVLPNDLSQKKVLVIHDQGLGDELFFLRFVPELKRRGAEVSYLPQDKIRSLVAQFDCVDHIFDKKQSNNNYDFVINVGNLPHLLNMAPNTPESLRLIPGQEQLQQVGTIVSEFGLPPYIGLTWRGGTKHKAKLFKEIPIPAFADALKEINATYISLQRLPEEGELEEFSRLLGKEIHDCSAYNENLEDMLALLSLLDTYIGVSNTNIHLSAALGKKAMVLVPHPGEWRWMAEGEHSPWFPGFGVYRQDQNNKWENALNTLHRDLVKHLS